MKSNKLASIALVIVGIHQLIIGVLGSLSPEMSQTLGKIAWGATVNPTPQYFLVAVLMNTYMIGFGIFALLLSKNPAKHVDFLWIPIVIFGLQAVQTVLHFVDFTEAFSVPETVAMFNVLVTAVVALVLYYCKTKLKS